MSLLRKWRFLLILVASTLLLSGCNLPFGKNIAGLTISITEGPSAQIFLDDLHLGSTPITKEDLKPGVYRLKIVPDSSLNKQTYETEIHLYPNSITTVLWNFLGSDPSGNGDILELEPLSSNERAELSVITVPEGSSVALNSTTYGLSPVILDSFEPGEYSLTVSAVGHTRRTFSAKVTKGFRLHVFSRLGKEGDALAQDTPQPTPEPTPTPIVLGEESPTAPRPTPAPSPSPTPLATSAATASGTLTPPYVTITDTGTGWLRVRDQASSAGVEIAKVTVGASYTYVSSLNGWYEIEYLPGQRGWISGQYATLVR